MSKKILKFAVYGLDAYGAGIGTVTCHKSEIPPPHLSERGVDAEQMAKALDIRGKFVGRTPLALVKEIAKEEDGLGPEVGQGGPEGAMHLPLAPQLVQPVTVPRP